MWYIQQLVFGNWTNSFSYYSDDWHNAKDHLEQLRAKHPKLEFRLILKENF